MPEIWASSWRVIEAAMARCHVQGAEAASQQEELASPTRPAPAPEAAHAPAVLKVARPQGALRCRRGAGGQGLPQCPGGTQETLLPTQGSIPHSLEITQALELPPPCLEK